MRPVNSAPTSTSNGCVVAKLRVYIDSPLIFNVVKRERGLWADSLKVLLAGERGDIQLLSSTLLLAEVCGFRGDVEPAKRDDVLDRFLGEHVEWIEVDHFVIRGARKLADTCRLRGLDATHLASAVRLNAQYLMTRDEKFPIGRAIHGVKVMRPEPVWNETLEDLDVDTKAAEEEAALKKAEEVISAVPESSNTANGTSSASAPKATAPGSG